MVRLLGQTMPDMPAIRKYLEDDFGLEWTPELIESLGDTSSVLAAIAGKRCYKSFTANLNPNVTKVRSDAADYFENIFKQGHGSVLEHISFNFAFEGVSRIFTHELVRHRVGVAISQESLRYVRLGNGVPIPMRLRDSLRGKGDTGDENGQPTKEAQTIHTMIHVVNEIEKAYQELLNIWDVENMTDFSQKKVVTSMLRDILPMGMATGMIWTVNARALRNIFDQRLSPFAEEEIRSVMTQVLEVVKDAAPMLFADYTILPDGSVTSEYGGI